MYLKTALKTNKQTKQQQKSLSDVSEDHTKNKQTKQQQTIPQTKQKTPPQPQRNKKVLILPKRL